MQRCVKNSSKLRHRILNGEDFAGHRLGQPPRTPVPRRTAAIWAGRPGYVRAGIRQGDCRSEGQRNQPAVQDPIRLAYRANARAPAPTTAPTTYAARMHSPPSARARRTKRPSFGCAGSETRPSLRSRCRDPLYLPRIVVTSGEPAGIGPDACVALAQSDWPGGPGCGRRRIAAEVLMSNT